MNYMNWNMFGPQQQGFRVGMPRGLPQGDMFSANPMARSGINTPSADNFRVPMPQQGSMGLQMPNSMSMGPTAPQQGLQVPKGLAAEMNAPLQPNTQPGGMNPMAMMQLMNMGMKMTEQKPQAQLPPAYRAPMMDVQRFMPIRRSLFSR
jgi:hypothetical protein